VKIKMAPRNAPRMQQQQRPASARQRGAVTGLLPARCINRQQMGALGELQAQLVRIAATSEGWQMMVLYALLIALWWYLRRCRRSADLTMPIQIAELWVYPVKSCAGVQLPTAAIERGGLQWDRQFAIVTPDGEVCSQKTYPQLAKICPSLSFAKENCVLPWGEPLPVRKGQDGEWERVHDLPPGTGFTAITLSTGDASVEVRLTQDAATKKMTTKWGGNSAPLEAIVYPAADVWLKEHLGFECSICRLSSKRPLRTTRLAPVSSDPNDCCRYQDGAPLTILSMASVEGTHAREQCAGLAHAAATHQPSIDLLATLFASRSFH
jgi:uncharacterized protein YcbX